MPDKADSIIDILNLSAEHLKRKGVCEPRLSAELIIAHALNIKRLDIYLQYDRILQEPEKQKIRSFLRRRSDHEPVQYITGITEFCGLEFRVTPDVLIPRHDTETAVLKAAEIVGDRKVRILEIGTGSGCISVSLAKKCGNALITATDISAPALKIAEENAVRNGVGERIGFRLQDLFTNRMNEKYDVLISNPPYIPETDIRELDPQVRLYEPLCALTGGADGLSFYRRIAEILPLTVRSGGAVILEIGFDQAEDVRSLYERSLINIEVIRDLGGNNRVITGIYNN